MSYRMSRKTSLPRCLCRTEADYRVLLPMASDSVGFPSKALLRYSLAQRPIHLSKSNQATLGHRYRYRARKQAVAVPASRILI